MTTEKKLATIGSTEYVEIAGISKVPAKIDTGADSSAVWASDIEMEKDGTLVFSLFGKSSPFYTGEKVKTKDYTVSSVKSSIGKREIRYRVKLSITMRRKKITTVFTLADRSKHKFPILVGRHALTGNFIVDVSRSALQRRNVLGRGPLNSKLKTDPYKFHQEYIEKGKQ